MPIDPNSPNSPARLGRREVRISTGGDNRGLVNNATVKWDALMKRLSHVTVTAEKFIDYTRSSPDARNNLKNSSGYWIGAHCADGRRKKAGITERDVMCFDVDNGSLYDGDLVKMLREGKTPISEYEFFVHSSRSHTSINPRLRLVFLLAKPVSADKYNAFSRILAQKLDEEMKTVDPVSFRLAQMMYLPSCSVDMEDQFVSFRNEGVPVDPDEILEAWPGDWTDFSTLPRCPGEEDLRETAAKAEDPTDKRGMVGAFCRTFDIYTAIQEFLPDVFEESDYEGSEVRYKYLGSEGGPGAVVYENGLYLYSHHGTDPHSDRLLNAWDLVRLHKFGDLDNSVRADTPITSYPSHKAMLDLATHHPKIKEAVIQERFGSFGDIREEGEETPKRVAPPTLAPDPLDDLLGETPATKPPTGAFGAISDTDLNELIGAQAAKPRSSDWMTQLDATEKFGLKPTSYNLELIFRNDKRLAGAFGFNELTRSYVQLRDLESPGMEPLRMPTKTNRDVLFADRHGVWVRMMLDSPPPSDGGRGYGLRMPLYEIDGILKLVADQYAFHPVVDWIDSVPWDGVDRIDSFLHRHLKIADTPYTRAVSRVMFLGASARVMQPGHKFDTAIILEGIQGAGKSSLISALANHKWFGELDADLSDRRKTVEQLSGFWFMELPELSAFSKRDVEEIKSFISGQRVKVRAAFERNADEFERQCILVGSTNNDAYLADTTGNRRFLPIKVPPGVMIDINAVTAEVQQCHAEAMAIVREMRRKTPRSVMEDLPLTLPSHLWEVAAEEVALRVMDDYEQLTVERVDRWADRRVPVSEIVRELNLGSEYEVDGDPLAVRNFIQADMIWTSAMGKNAKDFDGRAAFTVGRVMKVSKDWMRSGKVSLGGRRVRGYFRVVGNISAEFLGPQERVYTIVGGGSFGAVVDDPLDGLL